MPHDNVDALRPIYEEWGRGNFRPMFDVYDPEMEWGWSPEFPGLAGVYRDPAERNKRLHEWLMRDPGVPATDTDGWRSLLIRSRRERLARTVPRP